MTTQVATIGSVDSMGAARRPSLEELVDRVIAALFPQRAETTETQTVDWIVHDARRLRQNGDLDGAVAVLAGANTAKADPSEARWAYAEWLGLVKRRFGERELLMYSQGAGRAAVLTPREDGTLEVLAVLSMRWQPGKVVSDKSLRGLRSLNGGGSRSSICRPALESSSHQVSSASA